MSFETTAELPAVDEVLGQERAIAALQFGMGIRNPDYHVFAVGPQGVGKLGVVRRLLEARAAQEPTPPDWCYVHRFADPQRPRALRLPPGRGRALARGMQHLVEELRAAIPAAFESEEFRTRRGAIVEEAKGRQERALEGLQVEASARRITLVRTPVGVALAPVQDGKPLDSEEFEKLPEAERQRIKANIEELGKQLEEIARHVPQWEREARSKVRELARETTRHAVGHLIDELRKAWTDLPDVLAYLDEVRGDVVENAVDLMKPEGQDREEMQLAGSSTKLGPLRRYQVNVLVDHADTKGAPVVYEDLPTHPNLLGRIEHTSILGALVTDFTLLKPGALHRANGGYLVLDAQKLLMQPFSWEELKRALRARVVRVESIAQMLSLVSTATLEPEPIPLELKVVLVGEPRLFYLLSAFDPELRELFKVQADFGETVHWDGQDSGRYAQLLASLGRRQGLRPLHRGAVARVMEHSARLANDTAKLSVHMQSLEDLMCEASHVAGLAGRDVVRAEDIEEALRAREHRADRVREHIYESIERGTTLIDASGERVGQVNGLSVLQLGDFAFGQPSRITARVRLGKGHVVDIEREVELGGPLHSKGVLILEGYLGARYAPDVPLTFAASLVFEQSYGGVDGDSASAAELFALLSALADVPIRQSIAVTGSLSQQGDIQPIGGVNEKIEGFFDVCSKLGLTGTQGVIIPKSNVQHLMLKREVVAACAEGRFAVWPVASVDEAMELLTGLRAGERNATGEFPEGTVNRRVEARLVALSEKAAAFAHQGETPKR